jgi:hypothetical protein
MMTQYMLGHTNRYEAYVAIYLFAGFSTGTAKTLARADCDRSYNRKHVPVPLMTVTIEPEYVVIEYWPDVDDYIQDTEIVYLYWPK